MRCPSLSELQPPPPGKIGWPWNEETAAWSTAKADARELPSITVVTPSYNQAEFLEETIRSVLLQGYPKLEYLVIDGGSQDGSVEVIRKYGPWLAYWVSEPDRGQSHAINKGFRRATGDVLAWLNSDDIYYQGALQHVGAAMASGAEIYLGAMDKVLVDGDEVHFVKRSTPHEGMPFYTFPVLRQSSGYNFHFYQPSMFWTRDLWERTKGLDERYHYAMDAEWCHRALATGPRLRTDETVLTRFALHPESKTQVANHLQHRDFVLLYARLAWKPEFRPAQCLLAALRHLQIMLALRAKMARSAGKRAKRMFYRSGARLIAALRRGIPGGRGPSEVQRPASAA